METSTNAWCTLVMLGNNYSCGAAVVAKSLRLVDTKYPILCMVTNDVTDDCVEFLRSQFDAVITVPLITHKCIPMRSQKQRQIYSPWIHASFTKLNVLNPELFPYNKVIFLDADCYFTDNCDDLFDLPAMSFTFSSPWVQPYISGRNRVIPNPYFHERELAHGEPVSHDDIVSGLTNHIVGLGCMFMVSPDAKLFKSAMQILNSKKVFGSSGCMSGFDEQLLAMVIVENKLPVVHIHQIYNFYTGKSNWLLNKDFKPKIIQYYNSKPWRNIKKRSDADLSEWDDVKVWYCFVDEIIDKFPEYEHWFYEK